MFNIRLCVSRGREITVNITNNKPFLISKEHAVKNDHIIEHRGNQYEYFYLINKSNLYECYVWEQFQPT